MTTNGPSLADALAVTVLAMGFMDWLRDRSPEEAEGLDDGVVVPPADATEDDADEGVAFGDDSGADAVEPSGGTVAGDDRPSQTVTVDEPSDEEIGEDLPETHDEPSTAHGELAAGGDPDWPGASGAPEPDAEDLTPGDGFDGDDGPADAAAGSDGRDEAPDGSNDDSEPTADDAWQGDDPISIGEGDDSTGARTLLDAVADDATIPDGSDAVDAGTDGATEADSDAVEPNDDDPTIADDGRVTADEVSEVLQSARPDDRTAVGASATQDATEVGHYAGAKNLDAVVGDEPDEAAGDEAADDAGTRSEANSQTSGDAAPDTDDDRRDEEKADSPGSGSPEEDRDADAAADGSEGPGTDDDSAAAGPEVVPVYDARLTDMTSDAGIAANRTVESDEDVAALEAQVDAMEDDVEALSVTVATLDEEFESVRTSLDVIRDDLRDLLRIYQAAAAGGLAGAASAGTAEAAGGGDDGMSESTEDDGTGELPDEDSETGERPDNETDEQSDGVDGEVDDDVGTVEEGPDDADADGARTDAENVNTDGTDTSQGADADVDATAPPEESDDDRGGDVAEPTQTKRGASTETAAEPASSPADGAGEDFQFRKVVHPENEGTGLPEVVGEGVEKPYLESPPGGYEAEALVIEWLDWLVSAADAETAIEAVVYYERVDWISSEVTGALLSYLDGLVPVDAVDEPEGRPEALALSDHLRSLEYVTELAGEDVEVTADGV